jgi:hypothetical protein
MELDILRDLQDRGRFFWEIFPGAQASDEWHRQRGQIERNEEKAAGGQSSPPAAVDDPGEKKADTLVQNDGTLTTGLTPEPASVSGNRSNRYRFPPFATTPRCSAPMRGR